MSEQHFLHLQRQWRERLFEGENALRWRPGRELAAELLLYLDDPQSCWRLTTDWLRETLDADRVDGGYGGFLNPCSGTHDYVALAEAQRNGLTLPSVLGQAFSAVNPGLLAVWRGSGIFAVQDVLQERRFTPSLRHRLSAMQTASKLAIPLLNGTEPVGLICADWQSTAAQWHPDVCNELGTLAEQVLGPILALAQHGSRTNLEAEGPPGLATLTEAERRVAELVAQGLSYKEVARQLRRSVSTVDHQLRRVREKLGVPTTARLIRVLTDHGGCH